MVYHLQSKISWALTKWLEKQIAQLAAAIHVPDSKKNLGKPKTPLESINMVSTRLGKPLCWESHGYLVDPPFVTKKEDPGRPTITCSIGPHVFHNAFCDLRASINVMSKVIYDKILGGPLSTVNLRLQMADQTSRHPEGLAKDILVKIRHIHPYGLCRARHGPQQGSSPPPRETIP